MVSATSRTRSSSSGVRKKGRRNGQWTRSPKVSFARRIVSNRFSGRAGTRSNVAFRMSFHVSAGLLGAADGVAAPVILSQVLLELKKAQVRECGPHQHFLAHQ